ncbi:MAG TPA: hypothetical protein VFO16_08975 [Pseudonocardiaceae bacterium]|nr:hypothetical protein [Pseudonocardiaceae bacterium]
MNAQRPSGNPEHLPDGGITWPVMGRPRRVRVKGVGGIDVTVAVTTVRDTVWLSISSPFTWEAIIEPGKVDEVISILELARDEAIEIVKTRRRDASRESNGSVNSDTRRVTGPEKKR